MTRVFVFATGVCVCLFALLIAGCTTGPAKHEVSGAVDIDGAPINDGMIAFVPKEQSAGMTRAEALIKNGSYKLPIVAGSYNVTITAQKKVPLEEGEPAGTPGEKEKIVNVMPEQFNNGNPLTADIKGPATGLDFHVKTSK